MNHGGILYVVERERYHKYCRQGIKNRHLRICKLGERFPLKTSPVRGLCEKRYKEG